MPRLDFLDVSHWQSDRGAIDWSAVRAAGVLGVIIKATEGTSYKDPGYKQNRDGALKAGLKVASYHFLKHGSISDQMDHYLTTVAPKQGERLVIDYEDVTLGYADLRDAVGYLMSFAPLCEIAVYGSAKLTDDVRAAGDKAETDLSGTSAWMARYSSKEPEVATNAWPTWSAWQYSQEGDVGGVTGPVDLNTFNGSRGACAEWIGPPTAKPEPGPEPTPEPVVIVEIEIAAPAGVRVDVRVNGEKVSG